MPAGPLKDTVVIDRFEGDLAVLETGSVFEDVARDCLPRSAREGDHLRLVRSKDGTVRYRVDRKATAAARASNQAALDALNAGDDGGDLQL